MARPREAHHGVRALAAIAERMVRGMEQHPAALRLQAEVNRLRLGAEALDNVRASRSPRDTPEAHALKVAALARKFNSEVTASMNRCGAIACDGNADINRRIAEKVDLKPDAFAQEIRAAFRSLPRDKQMEQLAQLVNDNRGPELAAIVKAPALLTGISSDDQAAFEKAIISRHAPAELEEQAKLEEVLSAAFTATSAAGKLADSFIDPHQLARIESNEAAANTAAAAFDQSLQ